ncbi:hypothetical protein MP228_011382 [Amoeboaphelidium protococcarum]|nr:hypothetical protein MP228_011382 [Amoeboaphelidium protococcarum]
MTTVYMLKSGLRLSTRTPLKGRSIAPCYLSHGRYNYGTIFGNGARTLRNGGNKFYSTASSGAANNVVQFNLADIGEGITECELVQWYVKTGSKIQQFDKICEVQSDKATVEITSRYDGTVSKLYYEKGQMAKVGSPLVDIQLEGSTSSSSEVGQQASSQQQQQEKVGVEPHVKDAAVNQKVKESSAGQQQQSDQRVYKAGTVNENVLATPAVRRMAKEMKIDLNSVKGTGRDGRITKEDLLSYSPGADQGSLASYQSTPQQQQQSNQSSFQSSGSPKQIGSQTTATPHVVKLTGVQKAMLKGMSQSLRIPHFGFSDEIEFDQLSALRAGINKDLAQNQNPSVGLAKISFMPLLLKSFSVALQRYPLLNAKLQLSDQEDPSFASLLYRPSHNIGVAIDSPGGLVVPNIKAVDQKSMLEIALDLQRLVDLAKKGQLPPDAFKDTTITMSNIGNIGGRVLSPVIPPDTLCIVAIGRIQSLPRFVNNGDEDSLVVTKKQIVTASFSADHRVVDGATVAKFFAEWKSLIEDPARMLMNLR